MNQLQHDWLDALLLLRPRMTQDETVRLVAATPAYNTAHLTKVSNAAVLIHPAHTGWTKVERVEYLMACAAERLPERTWRGHYTSLLPDPRERWRQLNMREDIHSMPVVMRFEDRRVCQMCGLRIATGAENAARPHLHDECANYAHTVLVPALKAQRAAQAQTATNEADR